MNTSGEELYKRLQEELFATAYDGEGSCALVGDATYMEIVGHLRENSELVRYTNDQGATTEKLLFMGHEIHHLPCLQSHGWIIGRKQDMLRILESMKAWDRARKYPFGSPIDAITPPSLDVDN